MVIVASSIVGSLAASRIVAMTECLCTRTAYYISSREIERLKAVVDSVHTCVLADENEACIAV